MHEKKKKCTRAGMVPKYYIYDLDGRYSRQFVLQILIQNKGIRLMFNNSM